MMKSKSGGELKNQAKRRKPIPIIKWMLRVGLFPLIFGIVSILVAAINISYANKYEDSPIVPIWMAFGVWPWYALLFVGVLSIFYSWLKARQWQTGIFLWE